MKKSTTLIALTTLSLLPVAAMAALTLGESAGFIKGGGTTPTHDFPVVAKVFSIGISAPDAAGLRTVQVSVPVEQISTDNYLRDVHMRSAIFGAGLDKGIKTVEFVARTDQPVGTGRFDLKGQLTINGVTRPNQVALKVSGEQLLKVEGTAKVSLSAYGIAAPGMGPMQVADEVSLELSTDIPRAKLLDGESVARVDGNQG